MKWAAWVSFVCGLWLIGAPFVLRYSGNGARTDDIVFGILIAVFAFRAATAERAAWAAWLVFLAAIWVILAPFVIGYSRSAGRATNNDVITGMVVFVFALTRALSRSKRPVPPLA